MYFESLFGGSSRGAQLLVYRRTVALYDRAQLREGAAVREEGDTRLASQISRINPGDQWGDRCRSQIALTSLVAHPYIGFCSHHSLSSLIPTALSRF